MYNVVSGARTGPASLFSLVCRLLLWSTLCMYMNVRATYSFAGVGFPYEKQHLPTYLRSHKPPIKRASGVVDASQAHGEVCASQQRRQQRQQKGAVRWEQLIVSNRLGLGKAGKTLGRLSSLRSAS